MKCNSVQRSIDKWGPDEVRRWTANAGLASYSDVLAPKGGLVRFCAIPILLKNLTIM